MFFWWRGKGILVAIQGKKLILTSLKLEIDIFSLSLKFSTWILYYLWRIIFGFRITVSIKSSEPVLRLMLQQNLRCQRELHQVPMARKEMSINSNSKTQISFQSILEKEASTNKIVTGLVSEKDIGTMMLNWPDSDKPFKSKLAMTSDWSLLKLVIILYYYYCLNKRTPCVGYFVMKIKVVIYRKIIIKTNSS